MISKLFIRTALAFSLSIFYSTSFGQSWAVTSIGVNDTIYNCSTTTITVNTYLGCINWTDVSQTDSVVGSTIGIDLLKNDPMICFGAITYPVYNINVGTLPAGSYTITVKTIGVNIGTYMTMTKSLVVLDCCPNAAFTAEFSIVDSTLCLGDSLHCVNNSQGTGLNYWWYVDGILKDSSTDFNTLIGTTGSHDITLQTDSASCTRSVTKEIEVVPVPVLNLGPNKLICAGQEAILNAGPGWDSLLWSTAETTVSISVTDSGVYKLTARDTSHCALHYDSVEVSLKPSPEYELGNDTTLCEGFSLLLDASYINCTYSWQDNSTNPTLLADTSGKYWVKVTLNINGCFRSDTINVEFKNCVGLEESFGLNEIIVWPNPASEYLNINSVHQIQSVQVIDIHGKTVFTIAVDNQQAVSISLPGLPQGVYLLRLNQTGSDIPALTRLVIE